jgi:membrane-bound lytic murein transglycosylase B
VSSLKKISWLIAGFLVLILILFIMISSVYGMEVVSQPEHDALIKKIEAIGYTEAEIFGDERVILLATTPGAKEGIGYFSPESKLFQPDSIRRGQEILREKMEVLQEAEKTFGVKKEILLAVFRLETNFGRFIGKNLVFNSLYRIFVFKERKWGEGELLNYLKLCRVNGYDPLNVVGSDMGAFGMYQFLPSSFINFAKDWDGDGKIDLFSFKDALFSAANYLRFYGCNKKTPVKIRGALFIYNHQSNYVKAILAYAETLDPNFNDNLLKDLKKLKRFVEYKYGYKK